MNKSFTLNLIPTLSCLAVLVIYLLGSIVFRLCKTQFYTRFTTTYTHWISAWPLLEVTRESSLSCSQSSWMVTKNLRMKDLLYKNSTRSKEKATFIMTQKKTMQRTKSNELSMAASSTISRFGNEWWRPSYWLFAAAAVRLIAINGAKSRMKLIFKWWNDLLLKLMS